MKKSFLLFLTSLLTLSCFSQKMTLSELDLIFIEASDSIISNNSNQWRFVIKEVPFVALADSTHNRMRIISPIIESARLNDDLKTASLMANFHTALDIKYAISDNILWSAYVHPLKELSKNQVLDAIQQVYNGNVTFGTSFSSTSLVFPGSAGEEQKENDTKEIIHKKI